MNNLAADEVSSLLQNVFFRSKLRGIKPTIVGFKIELRFSQNMFIHCPIYTEKYILFYNNLAATLVTVTHPTKPQAIAAISAKP